MLLPLYLSTSLPLNKRLKTRILLQAFLLYIFALHNFAFFNMVRLSNSIGLLGLVAAASAQSMLCDVSTI
jgi:hypothetical protein